MKFDKAIIRLVTNQKIRVHGWTGYWELENGRIKMHTEDGKVLDLADSEDILYTLKFVSRDDWEVVEDTESPLQTGNSQMDFGEALKRVKCGFKLRRFGWHEKGTYIVYQKGYPDGIPCNEQTAAAWDINPGDLFMCNPYLQKKNVDGSCSMYSPSTDDVLAEDWYII